MERRQFITLVGGAATWSFAASAQPSMPVIGVLSPQSPQAQDVEGLRAGLRDLGYVEGRNIRFEYRWAQGDFARLPDLAADLVLLNVNVLVTFVTQASLVAQKATSTIPIVMVGVADPVSVGLIGSLARPGGNVTGTSSVAAVLASKQLNLLKEILPTASRIAALWNPANPAFQSLQVKQAEDAARNLGVELKLFAARSSDEIDAAFAAIDKEEMRAVLILLDPLFSNNFRQLVELTSKGRLAAMTGSRAFADAGGLMAYGPNYYEISKSTAVYVDKILKGAKPADLPVEQPTNFEFVINLKAARELGLTFPPGVLAIATDVID